ncbi:MAG: hypothetical protein RJQ09_14320 [Cyclobacteriaceae bacterium]
MKAIVLNIASVLIYSQLTAQGLEIHAGMGIPETVNGGLRYVHKDFAAGLGFGFLPGYDQSLWTISSDFGFTYGKIAKKANSRRSQFRLGLTYYREETEKRIFKNYYFNFRAGRNFFFTQNVGFGFDAGLAFKVAEDVVEKEFIPPSIAIDFLDKVLPSASLRFFYRIN